MVKNLLRVALPMLLMLFMSACCPDQPLQVEPVKLAKDYNSDVVQQWQDLFLQVERYAEVYRPCPAARMAGYVGLAVYESTVAGMPTYQLSHHVTLDWTFQRLKMVKNTIGQRL